MCKNDGKVICLRAHSQLHRVNRETHQNNLRKIQTYALNYFKISSTETSLSYPEN